jgi:hypothetical protein
MKCLTNIQKMANSVGASVENLDGVLHAYAPVGYWWNFNDCSVITLEAEHTGQSWYADACKEMFNMMKEGLIKCSVEESQETEYAIGEPWFAPEGSPNEINL